MKDRLEIDYFIYYMMPTGFPYYKLPRYAEILKLCAKNWERDIVAFTIPKSQRHNKLFEWYAYYADEELTMIGERKVGGHTEQEAIRNLKKRYETRNSD